MKINPIIGHFACLKTKNRTLKIMKVTLFMMFACAFQLIASTGKAQNAVVKLSSNTVTVETLFAEIENQTDYLVVYSEQELNPNATVTLDKQEAKVSEVLDEVLEGTNLKYEYTNNYIVFSKKANATQQNGKTITGVVKDKSGEPIIGANVLIKGQSRGAITDMDGRFTLEVPTNATLQISYIGYTTQEISVGNRSHLNVVLNEDSESLDEVVVVGYGTQKKANLSGAVETVSSKALENRSTSNVGLALQGLVPNLNVTPNGGQANAEPSFNIRGETSINGGSPLILVDGVPTSAGDFGRMNSMDIESISVLKDASSAAIYGARASFGVILVTTKKGKGEKLTVQFNNTFNVRTLTNMPKVVKDPYIQASYKKVMGAPWYDLYSEPELEYAQKRVEDPSLPEVIVNPLNPGAYSYLATNDWFETIFDKTSTTHQHNLSISGATDKVSYYVGAEYYGESGFLHFNKDHYSRFNVRSRTEYRPTNWLTVGNNTAFTYSKYSRPSNFSPWMYTEVYRMNPLVPVYNPDGTYTKEGAQMVGTLVEGGETVEKGAVVYTQFSAEAALIKDVWKLKADFTAKLNDQRNDKWDSDRNIPYQNGPETGDVYLGWTNYGQKTDARTMYTMVNLYTDFQKDLGVHHIGFVGGFSQEYENYNYFNAYRKDLITDTYPSIQLATGDMTVGESEATWALRSAFYRFNYMYDNKYIFEANGRYDGSSRFAHKDRFGFFPSFSAAWVFSRENFMKSTESWLDHAKLRVSYGSLGNQNVDTYAYIASMGANKLNYLLNGSKPMGIYKPGLVSNALTWEKVYTMNVGLDLNMLSNRLTFSADVYRRDTKDMLTKGMTLPSVLGTSEPKANAADMKTEGWEVSIGWRDQFDLMSKPFNYSARFILSDSRSWITRFDNPSRSLSDYYEGMEIGEIWGMVTEGFFKDQADIDSHADQWQVTAYPGDRSIEPGDLKYKDLNGDGEISKGANTVDNPGDFKVIGNNRSRYLYGLDLNADWNGFDLRVLFQGVGKRDWYPRVASYKFFGIFDSPWCNVFEHTLDHWTPENPDAYFPRLKSYLSNGAGDMSIAQTRYLQNAAYLRLKNITFGYTLPKPLVRKVHLENVRIYFSGENLFEATKLSKNFDPEQLDQTTHPLTRTFSFGLNITL